MSAQPAESDEFPTRWVIDVCRTCGRLAHWPFCEHRDQPRSDDGFWCTPITVTGNVPTARRLHPAQPTEST